MSVPQSISVDLQAASYPNPQLYSTNALLDGRFGLALLGAQVAAAQPLPEGNTGIASRYPGDVGIAGSALAAALVLLAHLRRKRQAG